MGTLGACAQFTSFKLSSAEKPVIAAEPVKRDLPAGPDYARPVNVPEPKAGEDPVVVAARERAGRVRANGIIRRFVAWYSCVRSEYAGRSDKTCK